MINIKSVTRREELPYTLNGSVGSGGYATVLDVSRDQDGVQFAMKVMHTQKRNRSFIMETLLEEVKNIQALQDHHHFIRVYEAYETKTEVGLLVWPLADQRSLAHCLEEYLESDDSSFALIFDRAFGCLASGLAFMHEKHIRHKDIKPANILVHAGRVLYCDFGRSYDSTLFESSTTEGPAHATRMYMAPEVMTNQPRNSKSDVYSLGCVFLELIFALELQQEVSVTSFSSAMPDLHVQISGLDPDSTQRKNIATKVIEMTSFDPLTRPSSAGIALSLQVWPTFCCQQCHESLLTKTGRSEPVVQTKPEWIWSEPYQRYYYITYDARGKPHYVWN